MGRGLDVDVHSVVSVFVSRWDRAVAEKVPDTLRNRLGIAVSQQIYRAHRDLLESERWQRLAGLGARPQRLLFASTGVKDTRLPETFYVNSLVAPNTINTLPEKTLKALVAIDQLHETLPRDGGDCDEVLAQFTSSGIHVGQLANELQSDGARAFVESWKSMLSVIGDKSSAQKEARHLC